MFLPDADGHSRKRGRDQEPKTLGVVFCDFVSAGFAVGDHERYGVNIRYFSMRVHQTSQAPRLAINYVFPVRTDATGHGGELKKRITLALPVPWNLFEGVDLKAPNIGRMNETYLLNSEVGVVCDDTAFGKLEPRFNPLPEQALL